MMRGHPRGAADRPQQAQDVRATLERLVTYLRPHAGLLLIAGLMMVLNSLFQILGPYLTGRAVDQFIGEGDRQGLNRTMLLLLGAYLGGLVTRGVQTLVTVTMGQRVLYRMRERIFEHFQRLSLEFFDRRETGDLMSRLTNDTEAINNTLNMGLPQLLGNIVFLIGVLIAMLALDWQLALISMVVLPLMFVSTLFFSKRVRAASRLSRQTLGEVSSELEENIAGVKVVQAFGREEQTAQEFRQVNAQNRDANVQAQTVTSAFRPTLDIFSTVGIALVLGAGGVMALDGAVTVGLIFAFLGYVRRFFQPVRAIGMLYAQVQTAIASAERIFELLDTPSQVEDRSDAARLDEVEGRIVFEHVTFAYEEGETVLRDVSFTTEPGEMVAIVGPTGAGKTTMVNLLMRFYDVMEGRVLVDGYDVRDVQKESLRDQIGMVLQDTFLFAGTIMENIRYGRLDATDGEAIAAARTAGADGFIRRLPDGYDTELSERGASLSLGQRQLIAIARAMLANPRILILDEATSSVDTRTERVIQAGMRKLMKGRTSLVIAHRLSTIREADQVLVLCEGRIVERGTHDALLAAEGFYHALYMSQFGETTGDPVTCEGQA
jgi:ATP-binding cassette subfamily B protein/subfamily B ATP-binding cassette protein MsbA